MAGYRSATLPAAALSRAPAAARRSPARPLALPWLGSHLDLVLLGSVLLVAALLRGVHEGQTYSWSFEFLPGLPFALGADANSVLFVTLSTVLWFWTTLYAVGYLEESPHRSRFFGFFSLCVTATTGSMPYRRRALSPSRRRCVASGTLCLAISSSASQASSASWCG